MKDKYYPPVFADTKFHCPHCSVFAKQYWTYIVSGYQYNKKTEIDLLDKFSDMVPSYWIMSKCDHCNKFVIWIDKKIVYPKNIPVENPNDDLSDEIKKDYIEAALIFNDSPRAAAALLRLSLQKICKCLGEKGDNINDDIKELVKKGLNPLVQKSLDALRITGNNAVHPGEINLEDEPDRVLQLFALVNFIAEKMITEPKEISVLYENLPNSAIKAIKKRDA